MIQRKVQYTKYELEGQRKGECYDHVSVAVYQKDQLEDGLTMGSVHHKKPFGKDFRRIN